MEEIGKSLREARERLGLTLEEVEKVTRIRIQRLQALENGEMDQLPSEAQARGFLKNYAEFLGLDSTEILRHYGERRGRGRRSPVPKRKVSSPRASQPFVEVKKRRLISSDLLITALITIGVIIVLIWGGGRVFASISQRASATERASVSEDPTQEPTSTAFGVIAQDSNAVEVTQAVVNEPTSTPPLRLGFADDVSVDLVSERQAWVKVDVDGKEEFQGRIREGDRLSFIATERIVVTTGNGGGVRVIFNGSDEGLMGEVGRVVIRVWTREGAQTPTPTATPTPTITPLPSGTPVPSPTRFLQSGG